MLRDERVDVEATGATEEGVGGGADAANQQPDRDEDARDAGNEEADRGEDARGAGNKVTAMLRDERVDVEAMWATEEGVGGGADAENQQADRDEDARDAGNEQTDRDE